MITKPVPFMEAIRFLLEKEQLPAEWDASMWQEQEPDFQTKAFFSAKVENARFLDRAQGLIFDYMAKVTEEVVGPDMVKRTALKVSGREHFVKRMRDFMVAEGMADVREFVGVNQKDVTDIRSVARLRLIFDTNVRSAYGFGQWKQGMSPAVLKDWPAARLIRDRGVKEPRPRHQANLGEVLLKTDPRWADFHNARDIGGFGVPWGPYGFNSGVTQEDVSKDEARRLGLPVDSIKPKASKVTDGTEASTKKMDPEIKRKLLEELRGGPKPMDPAEAAKRAAQATRRIMLERGLVDAEARSDTAKAGKYREAISRIDSGSSITVNDRGEKITLEGPANADKILRDGTEGESAEKDTVLPQPGKDRDFEVAIDEFRGVLQTDGEVDRGEADLDRSEQFIRIEQQAKRLGYLYEGLNPEVQGGREHDLTYDEGTGTVLKFTKPSSAAYVVDVVDGRPRLSNGDPIEYLERMALHEEIFGVKSGFVGIGGDENNRRIITRQDLVEGKPAWWEDITTMMVRDLGFTKLKSNFGVGYEDSYAYIRDDVAVFDMRPANVFKTEEGLLIAVDSIPVRLSDDNRHAFR